MSDINTVTIRVSVSPIRRPSRRNFSAIPVGSNRLRLSPCSSRSTIAWCSSLRRRKAPAAPPVAAWANLRNNRCSASSTSAGVVRRHPIIGDDHLRCRPLRAGHEFVIVAGDANHLHVGRGANQGPNALPHDQVVVSQEYGNLLGGHPPI